MVIQELMGPVEIPYNWKEFVFHRGCSVNIKSMLETSLVAGGKESKERRQTFFFTSPSPFGENQDEEAPDGDISKPRRAHYHSNWRHNQDLCILGQIFSSTRSMVTILANEIECNYCT